jgi:hypothetical protein
MRKKYCIQLTLNLEKNTCVLGADTGRQGIAGSALAENVALRVSPILPVHSCHE